MRVQHRLIGAVGLCLLVVACIAPDGNQAAAGRALAALNGNRYDEARRVAEPIADQSAAAAYVLGRLYYDGTGVEKDFAIAKQYFEKAAQARFPKAVFWMGIIYGRGHGAPADAVKSREYYRQAMELGDNDAKNNLAIYLFDGRGGPADKPLAVSLYQQAADGGNNYAFFALAHIYETGNSVSADPVKAAALYATAANRGFYPAHGALAALYARGLGVPHNAVYAAMHFLLATRPDQTVSPYDRQTFGYEAMVKRRDNYLAALTEEQRNRARTLAKLWPDIPPAAAEPLDLNKAG